MINPLQVLTRMDISADSPMKAVQDVRAHVEGASEPLKAAIALILDLTGQETTYDDQHLALHVAQGVVERVIKQGDQFNAAEAIKEAEENAAALRTNPALTWLFGGQASTTEPTETTSTGPTKDVAGVKLTVKANGKIKKGGKQDAALAILKERVVGKDVSNQDFIAMLVAELDMSKAGATTYAYNAVKMYSAETGTALDLPKSKKGRKSTKPQPTAIAGD
jgi:hypothetical protein